MSSGRAACSVRRAFVGGREALGSRAEQKHVCGGSVEDRVRGVEEESLATLG